MDEQALEPYVVPDNATHPAIIAERLMDLPEHYHLKEHEAKIDWLLRVEPKIKAARQVLGTCYMPTVQGELRDLFEWMLSNLLGSLPDFLIVLDREYWNSASPKQREILVYHELLHATIKTDQYGAQKFTKEGLPCWGMRGHSVEEFTETVARYGAHNEDIAAFVAACNRYG